MKRTTLTLVVLSEDSIPATMEPEVILIECDRGDYVLAGVTEQEEDLTGKQMADALLKAGSDPGFFQLDAEGNTTEGD